MSIQKSSEPPSSQNFSLFNLPEELICLSLEDTNIAMFSRVCKKACRISHDKVLWRHNFLQILPEKGDLVQTICSLDPSIEKEQNPYRAFLQKLWQLEIVHFSFLEDLFFRLHQERIHPSSLKTAPSSSCLIFPLIKPLDHPLGSDPKPIPQLFEESFSKDIKNLFAVFFLQDQPFQKVWLSYQQAPFSSLLCKYICSQTFNLTTFIQTLSELLSCPSSPLSPLLPRTKKQFTKEIESLFQEIIEHMSNPIGHQWGLVFSIIANRLDTTSTILLGQTILPEEINTAFLTSILFNREQITLQLLEQHPVQIQKKTFLQGLELSSKMEFDPLFEILWKSPLFQDQRDFFLTRCFPLRIDRKDLSFILQFKDDPILGDFQSKAYNQCAEKGFLEGLQLFENQVDPTTIAQGFLGAIGSKEEETIRYISDSSQLNLKDFEKGILLLSKQKNFSLIHSLLLTHNISSIIKEHLLLDGLHANHEPFSLYISSSLLFSEKLMAKVLILSAEKNFESLFSKLLDSSLCHKHLGIPLILASKKRHLHLVNMIMKKLLSLLVKPRTDLQCSPPPSPKIGFSENETYKTCFFKGSAFMVEEHLIKEVEDILAFCDENQTSPLQVILSSSNPSHFFSNFLIFHQSSSEWSQTCICYHIAQLHAKEKKDLELLQALEVPRSQSVLSEKRTLHRR